MAKKQELIEDRTIRNPMQQMKRHLKFKHKQERHKEREFIRSENSSKGDEHKKKMD